MSLKHENELAKLAFLEYFSKVKTEECDKKDLGFCNRFPSLFLVQLQFSGGRCTRLMESSHKTFFIGKIILKIEILDYFSKAKMGECDQEH